MLAWNRKELAEEAQQKGDQKFHESKNGRQKVLWTSQGDSLQALRRSEEPQVRETPTTVQEVHAGAGHEDDLVREGWEPQNGAELWQAASQGEGPGDLKAKADENFWKGLG